MKNTLLFICSTNNSGTFANHKYGELSYPKNPEMCDPIIVNPVVKKGPHPAAHPHLASYKEVPHHPPPPLPRAHNSNTANAKGVMSCEDKLEKLKLIATKCCIRKRRIQSEE